MTQISRRNFLRTGSAAAALTFVVSNTPHVLADGETPTAGGLVTPCVRISADGTITLLIPTPDMGQDSSTACAMILAEELEIDLDAVEVDFMSFSGIIAEDGSPQETRHPHGSGGSGSLERAWLPLRRTGAYARELFRDAASWKWKVGVAEVEISQGFALHKATGRRESFFNLVELAQPGRMGRILPPYSIEPKPMSQCHTIGKAHKNVKTRAIVKGEPLFGIDAETEGLTHAVIRRCPYMGGTVGEYDDTSARALSGVIDIFPIDRRPQDPQADRTIAAGIAVVADSYWTARKAADLLDINWQQPDKVTADSATILKQARDAIASAEMTKVQDTGNTAAALDAAATSIDVTYSYPRWAHTCMEPHNCTIAFDGEEAEVWVGHQHLSSAKNTIRTILEISGAKVRVHLKRMGTGLGRKYEPDFLVETAIIAKRLKRPVKLTWSREDEIEQDYPNPMGVHRIRAGVDEDGKLTAWHIRSAGDSRYTRQSQALPFELIPNYLGEWHGVESNIAYGAWRGPTQNTLGWLTQSALYELAKASGQHPIEFLQSVYASKRYARSRNWPYPNIPIHRFGGMLSKIRELSDFDSPLPAGHGRGIGIHFTFNALCAHVLDVEVNGTDLTIHKVTTTLDCGLAVNPNNVRAQIESGIHDGICAALYGNAVFENGHLVTNNFDSYQKATLADAPRQIDIHIMDTGETSPRGVGEMGLPPVIPALTNAILDATGEPIRDLPIMDSLAARV